MEGSGCAGPVIMYIIQTLNGITTISDEETALVVIEWIDGAAMIKMTGAAIPDWDLLFLSLEQVVNNENDRLPGQVACVFRAQPRGNPDH